MPLGLYIHVPFCRAICNYCNFNRGLFDADLKRRYVDAVIAEIAAHGEVERPAADTIYFGGGTPSLLTPDDVSRIIGACRQAFEVVRDAEITLEANPETVSVAQFAGIREAGVNRLSLGVQSLRDEELIRLSRLHDARRARAAFQQAREAGFDNVSLDLMMWLPGQRPDQWLESVDGVIALAPEHVSLYLLEVYPNAPLRDEMARANWSQAPDEDAAAMYLAAMDRLESAGLLQYEISNVARAGCWSRHNVKYWSDGEWLGIGCGAHSTRSGVRWKNVSGTEEYVERVVRRESVRTEVRLLTPDERLGEALFMGLRLTAGIDLLEVGRLYDKDVWRRFGPELQPFVDEGLLEHEAGRVRLTRRGMLLANEVMAVFV
jgi:oxygen-independent coproporphyrinogen-3 oxidase